jgi:hypothetical protein
MARTLQRPAGKNTGRCVAIVTLAAMLLAFAAAPTAARADTGDLIDQLMGVQNAMLDAASQQLQGDVTSSVMTLDGALATLESLQADTADPALADELGKEVKALRRQINATTKRVVQARKILQTGKKSNAKLNKLRAAGKAARKTAWKLGRPVVAEINARSAGFHKPGSHVLLQVHDAGCMETMDVPRFENGPFSSAISGLTYDATTGVIDVTMGDEEGGGRIIVSCGGREVSVLLYNYGSKQGGVQGLPEGFPTNLPTGTYALSYSAGGAISIPETSLGTVELADAKAFADQIVASFREVAGIVSGIPECTISTRYSSFDGSAFRATLTVRCSQNGASASVTIVFRIRRL